MFCKKKEEKGVNVVKVVLITAGAVLAVVAAFAVLYKFFKKHFKITFECEDCDFCDDDCLTCEDGFEPECVCDDDCDSCGLCDDAAADEPDDDIFGELAAE